MNFNTQVLFLFSALGGGNGLLLSIYFAFFTKQRTAANYFLGGLLFVLSVRIIKSVFLFFNPDLSQVFIQIGLSACWLIGPFLYLYMRQAMQPKEGSSYDWLLHILPFIMLMTIVGYYFPYSKHRYLWQRSAQGYLSWLMFTQWIIYIILSFILIKPVLLKLSSKTEKLSSKEVWMATVAIGVFIIWLAYFTSGYTSYIIGALSFSFVLYLNILFWILKRGKTSLFFEEHQKYASKTITSVEANDIKKKLSILMETEALYQNSDIKLKDLADRLDVSTHYLSQLLNDNLGQSFAQYINTLRVEESKDLIKNNHHFTLEAIGFEAGFSSKSSFYSTFKKITGVTPAMYKRQVS